MGDRANIDLNAYATFAENVGSGTTIYAGKRGITTLQFKTISVQGDGISLSSDSEGIVISGTTGATKTINWGNIEGTLSNQTDLQNNLDDKLNLETFSGYSATTNSRLELKAAGVLTDDVNVFQTGNTSLFVDETEVALWDNPKHDGNLKRYTISADTITIPEDVSSYIVADYDNGSPKYKIITDVNLINESNIIPVVTAVRHGSLIHFIDWDTLGNGLSNKLHERFVRTDRFKQESGLNLSVQTNISGSATTRNIIISSGVAWIGASRTFFELFDSSTDYLGFIYHSGGTWIHDSGTTEYNNTQYDDGTDLQPLNNNEYGINWVFRFLGKTGSAVYILGRDSYTEVADARAVTELPPLPPTIQSQAVYVGRIIVEKGETNAAFVESGFKEEFNATPITDHNDLANLTVGDPHIQYVLEADFFRRTPVTGATYTPVASDRIIGILGTTGSSVTINLPEISVIGSNVRWIFKDEGFTSSTNNIYINAYTNDLIEKEDQIILSANGGSVTLYNDGTSNWYVI